MNTDQVMDQRGSPGQFPQNQTTPSAVGIREAAQQAGQQLKQKASEAGSELKGKGAEALDQVRSQAQELADRQKSQLLDRLSHCGAATRKAAEQLRADNDPALAGYVEALASQIDHGRDYFRQRDYRGLLADTENFARRRPEIFFGGLFVAGLALARFLKASSRHESSYERSGREMPTSLTHVHDEALYSSPENRYASPAPGSQPAENLAFMKPGASSMPGCGCD